MNTAWLDARQYCLTEPAVALMEGRHLKELSLRLDGD